MGPAEALRPLDYIGAMVVVLVTVGAAFLVARLLPHANLSLLFLTGVLIVSARTGIGPSLLASVLSFLAFNFFFTPPYYTFEVADDGDVATLVFFLLMAAITGNLAARMYREMAERQASLSRISNLYEFGRHMSSAAKTVDVLHALAIHLWQSVHCPTVVILADAEGVVLHQSLAGDPLLPEEEVMAQARAHTSSAIFNLGIWSFLRLTTSCGATGLVALQDARVDDEQMELVRSLCDQAAVALDRTLLVADLERERLHSETEQLRSALLSSVSHDLRTPLASIIGSTTSLLEYGEAISNDNRRALLKMVVDEAKRLDRHIQNLLDMTRLGQGTLTLQRDWVDLHDIIASATGRLRDTLNGLSLTVEISPDVPLLWVHGILIEQALVNLLDNAVHFSPAAGHITLTANHVGDTVEIEVCDEGCGIPDDEKERVFDMFYMVSGGDRDQRKGTGLGLAICRGMVAAHGGSVSAHDGRRGQGTCMRVVLPVVVPVVAPE